MRKPAWHRYLGQGKNAACSLSDFNSERKERRRARRGLFPPGIPKVITMKKTGMILALCALALALSLGACKEKTLAKSGVLTKLEKFSLSITASDGTVYRYSIDGETKLDSKAEALGDTLEVISKGEYEEGVHAEEVKLLKAAEHPPVAVEVIYGEVADASNSSLSITAGDGKTYTILKNDETIVHSGHGITIGDHVEVLYTGSLSEENAVAQSIMISSEGESQAAAAPGPAATPEPDPAPSAGTEPVPAAGQETIRYVDGPCVDDTMNSILLDYEGFTYSILKDDSTVVVGDIAAGDTIRVFHKGNLSDGMTATKILLVAKAQDNEEEDFGLKKIYGTILDETKSSLLLSTDDGREVQIIKTDDTEVLASGLGVYVEVSYRDETPDGYPMALTIR